MDQTNETMIAVLVNQFSELKQTMRDGFDQMGVVSKQQDDRLHVVEQQALAHGAIIQEHPDQLTIRIALGVLGAIALVVVFGGVLLALNDKELPEALVAIGSGAAGTVGGILVTSRGSN